jgi:hypothetical protein
MRAEVERFADLLRLRDVSLDDNRKCEFGYEGLDESPRRRVAACCVGSIAIEGGGYEVGSGALCGESIVEGGDIGTDWSGEFGMDATDDLGPGLRFGETTPGAVESNDIGACVTDGLGGLEVRRNEDVAVGIVGLDDADDGEIGLGSKGSNARNTFGTETACSAPKNRSGHASESVEVIEWISSGCLTGDDEPAAKRL